MVATFTIEQGKPEKKEEEPQEEDLHRWWLFTWFN